MNGKQPVHLCLPQSLCVYSKTCQRARGYVSPCASTARHDGIKDRWECLWHWVMAQGDKVCVLVCLCLLLCLQQNVTQRQKGAVGVPLAQGGDAGRQCVSRAWEEQLAGAFTVWANADRSALRAGLVN
jgi:hypothetical protein